MAVHLPLPLLLDRYSGTLEEYDAVDGQLWTRHRVPTPGTIEEVQPHAHSLEIVTLRAFNGTSWDADEVSREEPPEPVDGVGQASPPDDLDNGEDDAVMVLDVRVDGTSGEHHLVAFDHDGYPTQAPPSDYRPVHSIYFYFQGATQVEAPPVG